MTRILAAALLAAALPASSVFAAEASDADVEKIMALLADMQCEMDPDDIEVEDDGFELDDVFCSDGQYDIDLNESFEVTNKKKE